LQNSIFKIKSFSRWRNGGSKSRGRKMAQGDRGRPLIEAYGLTETSPAACINPMTLPDYNGFIGLPISSTEVVVKDDEGKNLGVEEVGEICIRGPQVMQGYWNKPEETAKVMTPDGFF
jgi:long-chain acyl-CoA synthetase